MSDFIAQSINFKQGSLKRFVSGDFTAGQLNSILDWSFEPAQGKYLDIQSIKANIGTYIIHNEKKLHPYKAPSQEEKLLKDYSLRRTVLLD